MSDLPAAGGLAAPSSSTRARGHTDSFTGIMEIVTPPGVRALTADEPDARPDQAYFKLVQH